MIGSSSRQPDVMGLEDESNTSATLMCPQDHMAGNRYQEPRVGMKFNSDEDARQFYNSYARLKGFGTRKGNAERSRVDRSIISRKIVCCKEGFHDRNHQEKEGKIRREQDGTRVGCKAHILIKRRKEGDKVIWIIDRFEEKHNHKLLTPSRTSMLRSHRSAAIDNTKVVHVPGGQIYHIVAHRHGGSQHVPFDQRGMYIGFSRQTVLGSGDAQVVANYFGEMQNKVANFYHSIQVDEEGRISQFFWADAQSIIAYKYFGDIVSIDMWYGSTLYQMPFCIFTGLNHHQQTVMFGAALLCDKTEASFSWLLSTWLRAMSWKPPTVILTDQDASMARAIARILPTTTHHLHRWQILKMVHEKLGDICKAYHEFAGEFEKCLRDIETVDEFEMAWPDLITKYNLQQNEWLKLLYEVRQQWVPAYTRWVFTAGMSTLQHHENMNKFFETYLRNNMTLQELFHCYDEAVEARYRQESEFDCQNRNGEPVTRMRMPMLQQIAPLYTRKSYSLFEEELDNCFKYIIEEVRVDGLNKMYRLKNFEKNDARWHFVTFNVSDTKASCSCLKFESEGILCRHMLKVMVVNNVMAVPPHYILERWTMNAKAKVVYEHTKILPKADSRKSEALRYNDLLERARRCAEEGTALVDIYDAACASLQRCLEEIVMAKTSIAEEKLVLAQSNQSPQGFNVNLRSQSDMPSQVAFSNPHIPTSEGYP